MKKVPVLLHRDVFVHQDVYLLCNRMFQIKTISKISKVVPPTYPIVRGSTQREALATRSVEKNLELIFYIITPPTLVPK